MAFDTAPLLNALVTLVEAQPGINEVYVGVPADPNKAGVAYITWGRRTLVNKANQLLQLEVRFIIMLAYAVDGDAVEGAERAMGTALDALALALWEETIEDLHPGSVLKPLVELDMSLVDTAEYQVYKAQEYRRYPVAVSYLLQEVVGA
jgi:hypothetical protein